MTDRTPPDPGKAHAAAAQPIAAGTTLHTPGDGLVAGMVRIAAPAGLQMPAYFARPSGVARPAVVLVVSEIFGLHEYIADVARRLAHAGFLAVAPSLFERQGDATAYSDIPKLIAEVVSRATDAQVLADLDAAADWAGREGGDLSRLGVTGLCWGGRIVWMYAAHRPALRAGVAWYGPVARAYAAGDSTAIEVAARIRAPMLGLYGGADAGIPSDTVERMRVALREAGNGASEIVTYPDTPHAFHADYRPNYRREAAEDGWRRCVDWLRRHTAATP